MGAGVEARAPGAAGTRRWQRVYGVVMPLYKSTRNEEQTPCRWRRTRPAAARRKSESGGAGLRERSRAQGARTFFQTALALLSVRVSQRQRDVTLTLCPSSSPMTVWQANLYRGLPFIAIVSWLITASEISDVRSEKSRSKSGGSSFPFAISLFLQGGVGRSSLPRVVGARRGAALFRRPRSGTRASRPKFSGVAPAPLSNRTYWWAASDQTTFPQMPVKWRAPGRMANFVPSSSASLYVFSYTLIGSGCAL